MRDVVAVELGLVRVGCVEDGVDRDTAHGDAQGPEEGGGQACDAHGDERDEAQDDLLIERSEDSSCYGDWGNIKIINSEMNSA